MSRVPSKLLLPAALLVLLTLAVGQLVGNTRRPGDQPGIAAVRRGNLELEVLATGTLVAPESVTIASEIQSNRAKVIRLTPEGSRVEPGDVLVEFDPTPFEEAITKSSRAVAEAEANRLQAEEDARLEEAKADQQIAEAELRLDLARLELRTLEEGGAPLDVREAKGRMVQSAEQVERLLEDSRDAEAFLEKGFITRREYEETVARLADARRFRDLAEAQYENLVEFRQPAELERRRAAVLRAERELQNAKESRTHQLRRREALLSKARTAHESAQADLEKAREDLARTRIVAPTGGFLVYDEIAVGSDYRKIQIGDSVWQGQAIMTIPNVRKMAVETFLREFDVHKVKPGQPVEIHLEAFPEARLTGKVGFVGNLATRRDAGGNDERRFSLRILVDATDLPLRPGMTARTRIDVGKVENVLLAPVDAIFRERGKTVSYVVEGDELVERQVQTGRSNADEIVVVAGLEDGEIVSVGSTGSPP